VKLERHVGGLSLARKANYLRARGWREAQGRWMSDIFGPQPLARALHHQLTDDLSQALVHLGWQVLGFSERGYVQLRDGERGKPCSLPKALRTQARREGRPVAELTYSLFLAALLAAAPPDEPLR
jgi:membrane-bound lytic murein transglycosylase B